ncbi:MAG: membrane protein insertase YidC, partial [Rhodovarius sp.]|nr:membrane protein insertase YidC [Rhodovarius sp.]
ILLIFDVWNRTQAPPPTQRPVPEQTTADGAPLPAAPVPAPAALPGEALTAAAPARPPAPRVAIDNGRVSGTISARGLMFDELVLRDYRETTRPDSPLVRLFHPRGSPAGYFAQWGWTAADGRTRVPDGETDWSVAGGPLAPGRPVTFTWDNGAGVLFEVIVSLDENYMFSVDQRVHNRSAEAVAVLPWARVRRERTPEVLGFFILHEGYVGVLNGRLVEVTYSDGKTEAQRSRGPAFQQQDAQGWAGFTDKYWLTALMPQDPQARLTHSFRHIADGGVDRWQVDVAPSAAQTIPAGEVGRLSTRLFAGAKEVRLLDDYRTRLGIVDFDKGIDFGWFYWITKPFFYALDWLFLLTGNFGVAILVFTLILKIIFYPLANRAYVSMGKMKQLTPKIQELRERYKDDPAALQRELMAIYKAEKINPASGCLPILLQIPVFFALYKVLFVTIEMRHAPFFGWIQDLSAPDPTNLFNLFGLIPWEPPGFLHLPAWAIIMGITMWIQFKVNPTPPDPIQQKIFAWMPVLFTFMLASFPAGLIIYWAWNNVLSVAQQWYIMRKHGALTPRK